MFLKIISLGFLFYILYRFVFGFVVPIFKATQKIKRGFKDMQQQAHDNTNQQNGGTSANSKASSAAGNGTDNKKQPIGDYIDFEEIK